MENTFYKTGLKQVLVFGVNEVLVIYFFTWVFIHSKLAVTQMPDNSNFYDLKPRFNPHLPIFFR